MPSTFDTSKIEWDAGPVTVNFITGWYDLDQEFAADLFDASPVEVIPGFGNTFILMT
jgi:hypothetical protein